MRLFIGVYFPIRLFKIGCSRGFRVLTYNISDRKRENIGLMLGDTFSGNAVPYILDNHAGVKIAALYRTPRPYKLIPAVARGETVIRIGAPFYRLGEEKRGEAKRRINIIKQMNYFASSLLCFSKSFVIKSPISNTSTPAGISIKKCCLTSTTDANTSKVNTALAIFSAFGIFFTAKTIRIQPQLCKQ